MFFKEDTTFKDLREKSVIQWLDEMAKHEDIAVRGGVRATKEYLEDLKKEIAYLKEKNELKDEYLKKIKAK